ncbi:hypothetical protein Msub_13228 [Marinobacter subterrani]|uniref:Uncharacterized protein n=1 Tax=Marinobacter subterrani TaxID=1658765 RepID=A0A0J7JEW9_9GAMM|nr:hypothetical protein Msub_13228 [Marinobacter subterrani]
MEPLSEAYRKRKKRRKDEILVLNTYLRDTQRYRADADQLEYGSDRCTQLPTSSVTMSAVFRPAPGWPVTG